MVDKENKIEPLLKIGLTVPEARVYLALSELKEAKTGLLSEKSQVASSKIYSVLESLIKKGFVSYRLQNNQKVFIAASPDIIKDLFDEKQKDLAQEKNSILELIDELKNKQSTESPFSKYRYYEGITGLRAIWLEFTEDLDNMKKTDEILVYTGKREAFDKMLGLYEEFHKKRMKKGIKYRVIYPIKEKELAEKRKKQLSEVRFLKLENEAEWAIVGDKLNIQYATQKSPRGFIIEDKIFVATFKQVFNQLWESAKKN